MTLLMALSWLVYGGDVERMDGRDYHTRAAAYSRLKAAGIWAVPALKCGQRNGTPERHMRIELILNSRASLWQRIVRALTTDTRLTDAQLMAVAKVMTADPQLADLVYYAVDVSGGFMSSSSKRWVHLEPYLTGGVETEIVHMLKQTRHKLFLPPPPTANTMPAPNWWDN